MKRIILIAFMLAGCAPLGIKTDAQKIAASCATASASIKVLMAAHDAGKLSKEDAVAIFDHIYVITPICGAETPPTMDDVIRQTLLTSVAALQAAALKTTGEPQ